MSPLRYPAGWLAAGAAFVALVAWLSLTPEPPDAGRMGEVKIGHVAAYAWLMLWFAQLWESPRARIAIGLALALLGVGLEYAQSLTGYRTFAYADMRDNALGVAAGGLLVLTPLGRVIGAVDAAMARRAAR